MVRTAVALADPASCSEAGRLLTHTASHVEWAVLSAEKLEVAHLFSAPVVRASIAAARLRAGGRSISPFVSNLERVARAAAPRGGHVDRAVIASTGVQPPYSPAEVAALVAAAPGMELDHRMSFLGGLALGFGAGVVGRAALGVRADGLVVRDGVVWVPCAWAAGGALPVTGRWARMLGEVAGQVGGGCLTDIYSVAGRQRFQRRMGAAIGAPCLDVDRLRTTWICGLLAGGVPVDVLAQAAAISPWTVVSKYLEHVPPATGPEVITWLGTEGTARPAASVAPLGESSGSGRSPSSRPEGSSASVGQALKAFRPTHPEARVLWSGPVGDELRTLIAGCTSDPDRAARMARAASVLLAWASDQPGMPMRIDVLLRPSTLDRWVSRSAAVAASAASYRSLLRDLARSAGLDVHDHSTTTVRSPTAMPYSSAELARLCAPDLALSASDQRVLDTYLVAGLGAGGQRDEIPTIRASDVTTAGTVQLLAVGSRVVPVAPSFRSLLEGLVETAEAGHLTGVAGTRMTRRFARISATTGVDFAPTRLRATWLARHLERRVPVTVLVAAAGSRLSQINALLEGVAPLTVAESQAWLLGQATLVPDR